jgi:phthalate 3,4-dioxygenase ferredoxin reductase subunit
VRHGVVIVGASVGGVRAARALRAEGYRGPVTLVGEEPGPPCDRPPLSKQVLSGAWAAERAVLLTAEAAAADDIGLRLGVPATALAVDSRQVLLADGGRLPYDDLVIATGASPRPSPWQPESGVYQLRTLADCLALRERFAAGGPVVLIGAGFIGAETAAAARAAGCAVTLVDPVPVPLERAAGPLVGALLAGLHRQHGAVTRFGAGVRAVSGRAGQLTVTLLDGSSLPAATVVVGIGAVPNDQWLARSGLVIDNGVGCDARPRPGPGSCWKHCEVSRPGRPSPAGWRPGRGPAPVPRSAAARSRTR